eukprot:982746-Pleurochrysis_carterae.AAC.5
MVSALVGEGGGDDDLPLGGLPPPRARVARNAHAGAAVAVAVPSAVPAGVPSSVAAPVGSAASGARRGRGRGAVPLTEEFESALPPPSAWGGAGRSAITTSLQLIQVR